MSETKTNETETTKVEPSNTPFYKKPGFYLIIVSLIILIIVGLIVYFTLASTNTTLSATIIGFYAFGIVLLIVGILWASLT